MANECKGCAHDSIFRSIECIACEYDVQTGLRSKFKQKTKTNADRIRAMSDEELAEFLNRVKEPCDCCQLAVVEGACTETLCDDAMMKWLKQPAEEESV